MTLEPVRIRSRGEGGKNKVYARAVPVVRKPRALAGSTPLAQWRQLGRWPTSYDRFWEGLMVRLGKQAGTKVMLGLLQLGRVHGQAALRTVIEAAVALGVKDSAAVRHL